MRRGRRGGTMAIRSGLYGLFGMGGLSFLGGLRVPGVNFNTMPEYQLTEEQKDICRKDREKLTELLKKIMIAQAVAAVADIAVGITGIFFYSSEYYIPYYCGSFLCSAMLLLSMLGARGLMSMAQDFKPEEKYKACLFLVLFEFPGTIPFPTVVFITMFTFGGVLVDKCDSIYDDGVDCAMNPHHEVYRGLYFVAIVIMGINLVQMVVGIAVMFTSPKAFATNNLSFPDAQGNAITTMNALNPLRMQLLSSMQQQMIMQQQPQSQNRGTQPANQQGNQPWYSTLPVQPFTSAPPTK